MRDYKHSQCEESGEERSRIKGPIDAVGTKACRVGKVVKSRMKLAGYRVRMKDERKDRKMKRKGQ